MTSPAASRPIDREVASRRRTGDRYSIGYTVERDCILLTAAGDCPYLEMLDLLYDLLSDPGIAGPMPLVVDARNSKQSGLDVAAVRHLVRLMASRPEVVGKRRGVVVSNPYHAFLARVASIHARTWYGIETGVFHSLEEAQLWVAAPHSSPRWRARPLPRPLARRRNAGAAGRSIAP